VAWIGLAGVKRVTDDLAGALTDVEQAEAVAVLQHLVAERARIHFLRGNLCFPRGDIEGCLREHRLALELARSAGAAELEAMALGGLGDAEYVRGRMIGAHDRFSECVGLCERHGFGRIEVAARHAEAALSLAQQLGARRFETEALAFRAELHRRAGRRAEALADAEAAVRISRETGMAFLGPFALGALALASNDPAARRIALEEAEALLGASAISHNHLLFPRDAVEAYLEAADWDGVGRTAAELEEYTRREPLPFAAFYIARVTSRERALWRHPAAAGPTRRRSTAFATRPSGWVLWSRSPASRRPLARRAVDFGALRKFPCCPLQFLCKTSKIPLHLQPRQPVQPIDNIEIST
jgi:tetratricopeptide (TPR) repeat protein